MLTDIMYMFADKKVIGIHINTYGGNNVNVLGLFRNHDEIDYLELIIGKTRENSIGCLSFNTDALSGQQEILEIDQEESLQPSQFLNPNPVQHSITPHYTSEHGYIDQQDKRQVENTEGIKLRKIKHLTIINSVPYTLIAIRITDMISLVTDHLEISFNIWQMIISGLDPSARHRSIMHNSIYQENTLKVRKLTIYPMEKTTRNNNQQALNEDRATSQLNADYTKYMSHQRVRNSSIHRAYATNYYNTTHMDVQHQCPKYIISILSNAYLLYPNLTELSLYVYQSEAHATHNAIKELYPKLTKFPSLKLSQIYLYVIPDQLLDHEKFNYNYQKVSLVYGFRDSEPNLNTQNIQTHSGISLRQL
ncbi:hypothetical protein NEOKW01_0389 [Nematocida sp. AWRm80]|nr:hypothetical protein NEOKW01_0389 [Nematocida sp. AWRm80]